MDDDCLQYVIEQIIIYNRYNLEFFEIYCKLFKTNKSFQKITQYLLKIYSNLNNNYLLVGGTNNIKSINTIPFNGLFYMNKSSILPIKYTFAICATYDLDKSNIYEEDIYDDGIFQLESWRLDFRHNFDREYLFKLQNEFYQVISDRNHLSNSDESIEEEYRISILIIDENYKILDIYLTDENYTYLILNNFVYNYPEIIWRGEPDKFWLQSCNKNDWNIRNTSFLE